MPDSEAKRRWRKENTKNLVVNINKNQDKEIFEWLESIDVPYGALVKAAIKEYISKQK